MTNISLQEDFEEPVSPLMNEIPSTSDDEALAEDGEAHDGNASASMFADDGQVIREDTVANVLM